MRISDWSSDVCSSDLGRQPRRSAASQPRRRAGARRVGRGRLARAGRDRCRAVVPHGFRQAPLVVVPPPTLRRSQAVGASSQERLVLEVCFLTFLSLCFPSHFIILFFLFFSFFFFFILSLFFFLF